MTGVEGVGAVSGLANLFNTAITWFNYVQVAKQAVPRLQSLLVRLDMAQLRLTRWGEASGLTGSSIENEEALKNSHSYQLDEQQEQQAMKTFRAVAGLFEVCQQLCHSQRNGRSADDVKEIEIRPFGTTGTNWNPMHRYLHDKMQDIIHHRKNSVTVTERVKFAIYKKEHLEKLIKDINDHVDELYKIYSPPPEEQKKLGMDEMRDFLGVIRELHDASGRDPVIQSAAESILKQENNDTTYNVKGGTAQNIGTHQGGHYIQNVGTANGPF